MLTSNPLRFLGDYQPSDGSLLTAEGRRFSGLGRTGNGRPNPRYMRGLEEAAALYRDVMSGRRHTYFLEEAMTSSEFQIYMADIIDRSVLGTYKSYPIDLSYIGTKTVRDFRSVNAYTLTGGQTVLGEVKEQEEYPERSFDVSKLSYSVRKYGARMGFSWEAIVNDDLNLLDEAPTTLGVGARLTEERLATELIADANGPHASLYTAGNKNIINVANGAATNNPALSTTGLTDAWTVLSNMRDEDGNPIMVRMAHLVVPPALEVIANNLMDPSGVMWLTTKFGGESGAQLNVPNWLRGKLQVHVNPLLPIVSSVANGNRAWYLIAEPDARPAVALIKMRGYETPQLWIKDPNARRVGGGAVNPLEGDFDNDSIRYRVRHITGSTRIEPRKTVASNGSGA